MSLFNHWRKECKRNNAVVVKPQEQRSVISHLFTFEWCRFSDKAQIVWKNIYILRFARKATDENAKNNVLIKFKKFSYPQIKKTTKS